MHFFNLSFLFLLISSSLWANPEQISFFQLPENPIGQEIQIRGFLYQSAEGLILSAQPNLKSCCLSKYPKIYVHAEIDIPPSNQVITLQGNLFQKEGLYYLENAKLEGMD